MKVRLVLACLLLSVAFIPAGAVGAETPDISELLDAGQFARAEELLNEHLGAESGDDLARLKLGAVQLLSAAERLVQDGYRYGTMTRTWAIPFLRVGGMGGRNKDAEQVHYGDVRRMIADFQKSVAKAEKTLSEIEATDLFWQVDFHKIRLDMNGDDQVTEDERLSELFLKLSSQRGLFRSRPLREQSISSLMVGMDSADVYWLRGYCHALMALADVVLAYDHERLFEVTAHAVYADPDTEFMRRWQDGQEEGSKKSRAGGFLGDISDAIAIIHLMDFKLIEPLRMRDAREHLLKMVELSRRNWELVNKETDNRFELVPNPQQQSIIPGLMVTQQRSDAWQRFLDEAEDILNGKTLIPFWRNGFEEGLNLKRVFTDPRDFDLVLWVQGSAAFPYLEQGKITDRRLWVEFRRIFQGNFLGFAVRVN